jgi:hypothetical protein
MGFLAENKIFYRERRQEGRVSQLDPFDLAQGKRERFH